MYHTHVNTIDAFAFGSYNYVVVSIGTSFTGVSPKLEFKDVRMRVMPLRNIHYVEYVPIVKERFLGNETICPATALPFIFQGSYFEIVSSIFYYIQEMMESYLGTIM